VQIGPLIDEEALNRAQEHVQDALSGGARLLCGGKRVERGGFFFEPTVLADVPKGALCMYEETFAPVAPVCAFDKEAEAIEKANQSAYGLSAYAFTRDLGRMFRLAESLEAGMIGINDGVPTVSAAPFGGTKQKRLGPGIGQRRPGRVPRDQAYFDWDMNINVPFYLSGREPSAQPHRQRWLYWLVRDRGRSWLARSRNIGPRSESERLEWRGG